MGGFVSPLLNAGYSVAALDLPGHGAASGDYAPLPLLALSISEIASAFNQPYAVIAHSLGAAMTALAMESYGLKPDRAILISAPRSAEDYALAQAKRQGLSKRALQSMIEQITAALGEPLERYRVDQALTSQAQPLWLSGGGHNKILADSGMIDDVLQWLK